MDPRIQEYANLMAAAAKRGDRGGVMAAAAKILPPAGIADVSGTTTAPTTISSLTESSPTTVLLSEILTSLTTTVGTTVPTVEDYDLMVTDTDHVSEHTTTPFGLTTDTSSSTVASEIAVRHADRPFVPAEWEALDLALLVIAPVMGAVLTTMLTVAWAFLAELAEWAGFGKTKKLY